MKKISIIISAILIIFSSCETILDIDLPEGDKHIVISGIMTPDSIIKVQVSKSKSVLDTASIKYMSTAKLKLYEDDVFKQYMEYTQNGFFISTIIPQNDKEYKITADYGELKTATAKSNVPHIVNILDISKTQVTTTNGTENHIKIKIDDPAGTENYYFIAMKSLVYEYDENGNPTGKYFEYSKYLSSKDPVFRNGFMNFNLNGMDGLVFSDESFNGLDYSLDITAGYTYTPDKEFDNSTLYKIYLLSVTKDLYYYILSFNNNQVTTNDPFSQPVKVYTNIENGLGIFTAYDFVSDTIRIEYPY